MMAFGTVLTWLEGSGLALAVRDSILLTASLSAIHLLGVTLVGGGALVSGLRWGGVLFAERPVVEVARPAGRAILIGMSISVATGFLLFAARASMAVENGFFQLKMAFLVGAVVLQVFLYRRVTVAGRDGGGMRLAGVLGSVLCFGVVAAGCAYILLE